MNAVDAFSFRNNDHDNGREATISRGVDIVAVLSHHYLLFL